MPAKPKKYKAGDVVQLTATGEKFVCLGSGKGSKARIYTVNPLSESELESGFAIPESNPLWRSVMCYLEMEREKQGADAATFLEQERIHASAKCLGAHDILGQLIYDLEQKRSAAYVKASA